MRYKRLLIAGVGLLWCGMALPAGASSLSTTTLITPGIDGTGANSNLFMGNSRSLSRDGRITVFASRSTNHVPNDTNNLGDVFIYDRITKTTELISRTPSGGLANGESIWPTVSADGRYVVYFSQATDIVPGVGSNCPSPNQCGIVLVHDRTTKQTVVANRANDGTVLPSTFYDRPTISGNGRFIVFASRVPDPAGGTLVVEHLFMRDTVAHTTVLIGVDSSQNAVRTFGGEPTLSYDGRYATFTTAAAGVPYDTNGVNDVYLRDTHMNKTSLVSAVKHTQNAGNSSSSGGVISSDGRFVTFHSYASDFVSGDTRGYRDVFLRDIQTGETKRISTAKDGTPGNFGSADPDISDDGRFVTYYCEANNIVPADTNSRPDILLYDRFAGLTRRINVGSHNGVQANEFSDTPAISGDGKAIVFRSWAHNIVPPAVLSTGNLYQVYNPVVHIPYYDPVPYW